MAGDILRIVVNGATGGIATRQHLPHALVPIMREGGLRVGDRTIMPELVLVARDPVRLAAVAARHGIERWTTDLDAAMTDPAASVVFDAGITGGRERVIREALAAGKHVYSEKPVVTDLSVGQALLQEARRASVKVGVVEDKLFLPGMARLRHLARTGFFGRVTNFRLSFGFWFFTGHDHPDQRGSWNYRSADGGGLVKDIFPHWRYLVEGILGPIASVVTRAWTAIPDRLDERGVAYVADADDSNAALIELRSGAIGTVTASTATRVRGDDLMTFHVDGTAGSAVAGLHRCYIQPHAATPRAAFDAAADLGVDYRAGWMPVPDVLPFTNGFRMGWEAFLRHVAGDAPPVATLSDGLRDVALAEAALASARERRWVALDELVPASGDG